MSLIELYIYTATHAETIFASQLYTIIKLYITFYAGNRSKSSETWTIGTWVSSIFGVVFRSQKFSSFIFHSQSIFCTACNDSASLWCLSNICSFIFSHLSSTSCNQLKNKRPAKKQLYEMMLYGCFITNICICGTYFGYQVRFEKNKKHTVLYI